ALNSSEISWTRVIIDREGCGHGGANGHGFEQAALCRRSLSPRIVEPNIDGFTVEGSVVGFTTCVRDRAVQFARTGSGKSTTIAKNGSSELDKAACNAICC